MWIKGNHTYEVLVQCLVLSKNIVKVNKLQIITRLCTKFFNLSKLAQSSQQNI